MQRISWGVGFAMTLVLSAPVYAQTRFDRCTRDSTASLGTMSAWTRDSADACREAIQTGLMVAQFERSYVTTTDIRGEGPRLIFEGNIAPPFYIVSPGRRLALVLTPKVVLRMFNEDSKPVKTPSYMPRGTLYWFLPSGGGGRPSDELPTYASLTLSHHSNGQSGPVMNADGSRNHETGNFSTNFIELAYGGAVGSTPTTHSRLSVEYHPPGWYDPTSNAQYSHLRFHATGTGGDDFRLVPGGCIKTFKDHFFGGCIRSFTMSYTVTYLAGDVSRPFQGRGRFPLWVEASVTPTFSPDIAFFVHGYWGQDYYNSYYTQSRNVVRFGLQAHRGRTDPENDVKRGPARPF